MAGDETGGIATACLILGVLAAGFLRALAANCDTENRRHDIGAPRRRFRVPVNKLWPPPGLVPVRAAFLKIKRWFTWA